MYNSVLGACLVLKSHSALAGGVAILAADTMLLMIMLIGLLRHPHIGSTGTSIWHLLYKQVTPTQPLSLPPTSGAEDLLSASSG